MFTAYARILATGNTVGLLAEGACASGVLLAPETLAAMYDPQDIGPLSGALEQGLQFGLDLSGEDTDGVWTAAHGGDTLLQHARFVVAPDEEVAVIVLTNEATAGDLASVVARETLRFVLGERRGTPLPEPPEAADVDKDGLTEEQLDALEGLWGTGLGVVTVTRKGSGLRAEIDDTPIRLLPTGAGTFRVRPIVLGVRLPMLVPDLELGFVTIEGVDVVQVSGATIGARVVDAGDLDLWRPYVGTWVASPLREADALRVDRIEIEDRGDHLRAVATLVTPSDEADQGWVLVPLDETRARAAGVGRGVGHVVRVDDGVLTALGATFTRE